MAGACHSGTDLSQLFTALSETLNNQLRLANNEKHELTDEAQTIIQTIQQMEASLEDEKNQAYVLNTGELKVTYPLSDCLRGLKEKYNTISRLHRERFEQVKKLVQALESYSSHLETSFVKIQLPPTSASSCPPTFDLSPSYVAKLDDEFTRVYDEYNKRVNIVQTTSEEIVRLWSELGIPQAQTDSCIVQNYRESPEQLGLHASDMDRLRSRRDKLQEEKRSREKRLKDIRGTIEGLWDRLGIVEADRKAFLAANRGCGLRAINEFEDELARLNELKRQNLHLFVEDARVRIQELWDALYFSEEEMLEFTPAFSDVYSDALLSAHEAEIERLTALKAQRAPILAAIEKHKSLIADRESLSASAADASRLMLKGQKGEKRDPGKLLREEKMRKRIAKELPKLAAELTRTLQQYEEEYGRPFLVHGESYLDELEIIETKPAPSRSKTPSGLPPRSKTPGVESIAKTSSGISKLAQPPRPKSVVGTATLSKATVVSKTPASTRPVGLRHAPSSVISNAPSIPPQSPSKIPARAPLGHLQHGHNSPERRRAAVTVAPQYHAPVAEETSILSTRSMGPPRAPPPKMRSLLGPSVPSTPSTRSVHTPAERPESVMSNERYDERERMSYVPASVVSQDRSHEPSSRIPPSHRSLHHQPVREHSVSRQTSNSSSNMTTGTTASGSENWETFSDTSEMDAERSMHDSSIPKVQSKRTAGVHAYAHMAPPAKIRMHERIVEQDENLVRINGSDAAWSTEQEETY